jgi:hypothetical protein
VVSQNDRAPSAVRWAILLLRVAPSTRLGQYWVVCITSTAGKSQGALATNDFWTVDEVFDHDSPFRSVPWFHSPSVVMSFKDSFGQQGATSGLCSHWRPSYAAEISDSAQFASDMGIAPVTWFFELGCLPTIHA